MDVEPREEIESDPIDDETDDFDRGNDEDENEIPDPPSQIESEIINLKVEDKVDDFYKSSPDIYTVDKSAPYEYNAKFRIDHQTKELKVMYKGKLHALSKPNNPIFLLFEHNSIKLW